MNLETVLHVEHYSNNLFSFKTTRGPDIRSFKAGQFTMIGMAPPGAPGFAGSYEAAFVVGLQVFGNANANLNFAMAFGFHWWIYAVQSSTGIYYLTKNKYKLRELLKLVVQRSSAPSEPEDSLSALRASGVQLITGFRCSLIKGTVSPC